MFNKSETHLDLLPFKNKINDNFKDLIKLRQKIVRNKIYQNIAKIQRFEAETRVISFCDFNDLIIALSLLIIEHEDITYDTPLMKKYIENNSLDFVNQTLQSNFSYPKIDRYSVSNYLRIELDSVLQSIKYSKHKIYDIHNPKSFVRSKLNKAILDTKPLLENDLKSILVEYSDLINYYPDHIELKKTNILTYFDD
jgi:hypothetical protein